MAHLPSRSSAALDLLEASLNDIYLQIGTAFNNTLAKKDRNDARTTNRLRKNVPASMSRFHDALDELETELVQAKAILGRECLEARNREAKEQPQPTREGVRSHNSETNGQDDDDLEMIDVDTAKNEVLADASNNAHEQDDGPGPASPSQVLDDAGSQQDAAPAKRDINTLAAQPRDRATAETKESPMTQTRQSPELIPQAPHRQSQDKPSETHADAAPEEKLAVGNDETDINALLPGLSSYANDKADDDTDMDLFGGIEEPNQFDDLFDFPAEDDSSKPIDFDISQFDDKFFDI